MSWRFGIGTRLRIQPFLPNSSAGIVGFWSVLEELTTTSVWDTNLFRVLMRLMQGTGQLFQRRKPLRLAQAFPWMKTMLGCW